MKIKLSEKQLSTIKKIMQRVINSAMNNLRRISEEEWGLGEMDEIHEVESVDKIEIVDILTNDGVKIFVNIYINRPRYDFDNIVIPEISYGIQQYFPDFKVILSEIIDERKFEPGVDW